MRFNKPTVASGSDASAGYSGIPSWRRKWIENRVKWVKLECGHIEDLNDRALTLINSFEGSAIDCIECGSFQRVVRTIKPKPVKLPDNPLF